jgi:hypothetical protein
MEVPGAPGPEEPVAPAQPVPSSEIQPTSSAVPVTETGSPVSPKRTGLFVLVAALVLVLLAAVVAGPIMFAAISKTSSSSSSTTTLTPARAKITVSIAFVKALLNGDTLAIKAYLRDSVQKAITDAQWKELAAQDTTSEIQYTAPVWSGDTTAVIKLSAADSTGVESTGTLTFKYDETEPLSVVMSADIGGTTEVDTIVVEQSGTDWRIVSISNGSQTTTFDATLIKSMVSTSTASGTTTSSTAATP